ncbi:MAG TPA: NAD-dependent epimerase/dehydratase family protein [Thermomicrobiales bacterium]|nr:NAD-dependent epimerase/dehydratase family protein [Thermomicrobiales bacterium]
MSVALVTGSAGLVGSEAVVYFAEQGFDVVGIDNDMRSAFFGESATTIPNLRRMQKRLPSYEHHDIDIRDERAVRAIFERYGRSIALVIHAAAQPSHDWAATAPTVDFTVNANGTLTLLEATRLNAEDAVFIFTSTNKVYGDTPNSLPLIELPTRWEVDRAHRYAAGISEDMSIDTSLHSLFGASKLAADVLVQEYGRYFGMRTACFRGGCLTGPNHAGAQLHGFLSYLVKCAITDEPYTVFGYKGKQVRDNIHSHDLIRAFHAFFSAPRSGEVYNIGGGRYSNCSMLEAIDIVQQISGHELRWSYREQNRVGDHIWWISDLTRFRTHFPTWSLNYDVPAIIQEIVDAGRESWQPGAAAASG